MKKYLLLFLFMFVFASLFAQEFKKELNVYGGAGGGDFGEVVLGIQAGAYIYKYRTNIFIDANASFFNTIENFEGLGIGAQLGGIIEYYLGGIFFIGAGGGMGGVIMIPNSSYDEEERFTYPYIRGSFSTQFKRKYEEDGWKLGIYFDYCFDSGFKIGIRFHWFFDMN